MSRRGVLSSLRQQGRDGRRAALVGPLLLLVGAVALLSLAGCTSGRTTVAARRARTPGLTAKPLYRFVEKPAGTEVYSGCNMILSPAANPGTRAGAESAFQARGAIPAVDGQRLRPVIELVDVTDLDEGRLVDGRIRPVLAHTPEWIVEYPAVLLHLRDPLFHRWSDEESSRNETGLETVLEVLQPHTFHLVEVDFC